MHGDQNCKVFRRSGKRVLSKKALVLVMLALRLLFYCGKVQDAIAIKLVNELRAFVNRDALKP
jgi:hypothetical protein